MLTLHKQLLLSLLMVSSTTYLSVRGDSIFDQMWEEMEQFQERIEKRMAQVRTEIQSHRAHAKELPSIGMKMTDTGLRIAVPYMALKDRTLDAQFDQEQNLLTITAPSAQIFIHARALGSKQTFMSARIKQEEHTEQKDGAPSTLYSHTQMSQTFDGEIDLGQSAIEYDAQTKELIITIPSRKRTLTKIPVQIKEPKEEK